VDYVRDLPLSFLAVDGLAGLAVVLPVGAVVLVQLDLRLPESGGPVGEFLGDVAPEIIARGLGDLDGAGLGGGGGRFVGHGRM